MICLDIPEYCSDCCDFEPDVTKPTRCFTANDECMVTNTIIRCKYVKRCESIKRYLERQMQQEK